MKTEHILRAAAESFQYEFEAELRQRLLDVATAEIEQIVRAVSKSVTATICAEYNSLDRTHSLDYRVNINARTP